MKKSIERLHVIERQIAALHVRMSKVEEGWAEHDYCRITIDNLKDLVNRLRKDICEHLNS